MGRPTTLHRSLLLLLADTLLSVLAALVAVHLRALLPNGPDPWTSFWLTAIEICIIYPLTFWLFSLYDAERISRIGDEMHLVVVASLFADLLFAGGTFFTAFKISRIATVIFYALQYGLVAFGRLLIRSRQPQAQHASIKRRTLLIGDAQKASRASAWLSLIAGDHVQIVGYVEREPAARKGGNLSVPCLGLWTEAQDVARQFGVDDVLLAVSADAHLELRTVLDGLVQRDCTLWIVPDDATPLLYASRWAGPGVMLALNFKPLPMSAEQYAVKRTFDILLGVPLLLVSSPIMAAVALAVKLDSRGPALVRQQRVGEAGRLFLMYKFRSMVGSADEHLLQRWRANSFVATHKHPDDPRVTRVGRFIRRTSLDELPNLINVVKGQMSLVGPRPELPLLVERYELWQHQRFTVPQGMTGWWQVNGRSNRPMHLHTQDDLYYVQHYSLWLDLMILLKTLWVVLRGEGAY